MAEVDGEVVGRTSIRHRLNDFLLYEGGHIGYGVLPLHRRRGYAGEILRQSLERVHALEDLVTSESGTLTRRYWIQTATSVRSERRHPTVFPHRRRALRR